MCVAHTYWSPNPPDASVGRASGTDMDTSRKWLPQESVGRPIGTDTECYPKKVNGTECNVAMLTNGAVKSRFAEYFRQLSVGSTSGHVVKRFLSTGLRHIII